MRQTASDLFLSYSRDDRYYAKSLQSELVRLSLSVWFDETNIEAGEHLSSAIITGITNSAAAVLLVGESYFSSGYTTSEARTAIGLQMTSTYPVIPVFLDESLTRPEGEFMVLRQVKYLLADPSPRVTAQEVARSLRLQDDSRSAQELEFRERLQQFVRTDDRRGTADLVAAFPDALAEALGMTGPTDLRRAGDYGYPALVLRGGDGRVVLVFFGPTGASWRAEQHLEDWLDEAHRIVRMAHLNSAYNAGPFGAYARGTEVVFLVGYGKLLSRSLTEKIEAFDRQSDLFRVALYDILVVL